MALPIWINGMVQPMSLWQVEAGTPLTTTVVWSQDNTEFVMVADPLMWIQPARLARLKLRFLLVADRIAMCLLVKILLISLLAVVFLVLCMSIAMEMVKLMVRISCCQILLV